MKLIFRPIEQWPGPFTEQREPARFSSTWTDTVQLLDREIDQITSGGRFHTDVVIQLAASEKAMRRDGGLRADAKTEHPGVIISFEHPKHGPLQYFSDRFNNGSRYVKNQAGFGGRSESLPGWQMNARAIALGLEALRKIERYGIDHNGEQYRGFTALGSGIAMPAAKMTPDIAARVLRDLAGEPMVHPGEIRSKKAIRDSLYRQAARKVHPDSGGSKEAFQELQEAKAVLDGC